MHNILYIIDDWEYTVYITTLNTSNGITKQKRVFFSSQNGDWKSKRQKIGLTGTPLLESRSIDVKEKSYPKPRKEKNPIALAQASITYCSLEIITQETLCPFRGQHPHDLTTSHWAPSLIRFPHFPQCHTENKGLNPWTLEQTNLV